MFKLTKRTLGLATIVAAITAPPASYARVDPPLTQQQQQRIQAYQRALTTTFGPTRGGLAGPVVPVIPVSRHHAVGPDASSQRSFQWDDAGIGAGLMLMLCGAGAGSVAVLSRRRRHQAALE